MAKDPKRIMAINTAGDNHKIVEFVIGDGDDMSVSGYKAVAEQIQKGQDFIILDEDGNPSALLVDSNGTIRTTKDNSELNNIRGNTNLKENWTQ